MRIDPDYDIKNSAIFAYKSGTDANNNILKCKRCGFEHANTYLGCVEAAQVHLQTGHRKD